MPRSRLRQNILPVCEQWAAILPGLRLRGHRDLQVQLHLSRKLYNLSPVNFQAGTIQMSSTSEMIQLKITA